MKDAILFLLDEQVEFTVTYRKGIPFIQISKHDQSGAPNISEPVHDHLVGACDTYTAGKKCNIYQMYK